MVFENQTHRGEDVLPVEMQECLSKLRVQIDHATATLTSFEHLNANRAEQALMEIGTAIHKFSRSRAFES